MDNCAAVEEQLEATELCDPIEPLPARIEKSRVMGEYYRDLSANYLQYERTTRWPDPPYPPARHPLDDLRFSKSTRVPNL